ncbi:MAG: CinA family protein [Firmicutes bacterium]|nr:CinA family protein [Bacillota bacterium]
MELEQEHKILFQETYILFDIEYMDAFVMLRDRIPNFRNISWNLSLETGALKVVFSTGEQKHFNKVIRVFKKEFKDFILTLQNQSLEEAFFEELSQKKAKVSLAESVTGGLIASRIIDVSGASNIIEKAYICYSNEAKIQDIGVNLETIQKYGAVSLETAKEMCIKLSSKTNCDIAISTTGIAGPGGGTKNVVVGTVYFGLKVFNQIETIKMIFSGDRNSIRKQASAYALAKTIQLLRKYGG